MVKKYIAIVGIALFVFVCIAMPMISETSYINVTNQTEEQSYTLGKHYFTYEETEAINSKIKEVD